MSDVHGTLQDQVFCGAGAGAGKVAAPLAPDFRGAVGHPVNDLADADEWIVQFVRPLKRAFAVLQRHPLVALREGGAGAADSAWEFGTGYLVGHFDAPLFGIPAHRRTAYLRYTEMLRLDGGSIAEWYLLPDFIDLMDQVGVNPLRPALGAAGRILPPRTLDGLYPGGDGSASTARVLSMLEELGRYDGRRLDSMDLAAYWAPDFLWYGPGGIGTTRGIAGFRRHHQGPFLRAFPDRVVDHHVATIGAGAFAATGGWPHMHATHSGPGWLGLPATGSRLELRVMDIWRCDGDRLAENWVGIDIPHMLHQMGLDLFEQMRCLVTSWPPDPVGNPGQG
mgnify:CR=1 FL=1